MDQKTRPSSHAEALYPSTGAAPAQAEHKTKDTRQAWLEHQQQMAGLRAKPKQNGALLSDRERGSCSPLGGQAVRQPVKEEKAR
jgi:hypothetical protein